MPLEIRELIIKASVGDEENASRSAAANGDEQDREQAMVQSCVEAVLEILKQRTER